MAEEYYTGKYETELYSKEQKQILEKLDNRGFCFEFANVIGSKLDGRGYYLFKGCVIAHDWAKFEFISDSKSILENAASELEIKLTDIHNLPARAQGRGSSRENKVFHQAGN
jgi:hypothetical protein